MYGEGVKGDRSINGGLRVLTMLHPRYEGLQKCSSHQTTGRNICEMVKESIMLLDKVEYWKSKGYVQLRLKKGVDDKQNPTCQLHPSINPSLSLSLLYLSL